jgi:hypothetical protein
VRSIVATFLDGGWYARVAMTAPITPEQALGSIAAEPLELALRCTGCSASANFEVAWAVVDVSARKHRQLGPFRYRPSASNAKCLSLCALAV